MQHPEEFFSLFPELAFSQAIDYDVETYPTPDGERTLLVLGRYAMVEAPAGCAANREGKTAGAEVVAYHCDENGIVQSWEKRYEVQGPTIESTLRKLRYLLANGLIGINHYEGMHAEFERVREQVASIDWEQMPENLQ